MRADIYWIDAPVPGRIGIGPRPRGGDWLADEVRGWREAGIDIVVSLLDHGEDAELGLINERFECESIGIEFDQFTIPDRGLPSNRIDFARFAEHLKRALANELSVFIHCRQGIGRSTMLAACVLSASGIDPSRALAMIETARGRPVPDTEEQREWILLPHNPAS